MYRKNHCSFMSAVFLTVCLVLIASSAIAQIFEYKPVRQAVPEFIPGEILVKFKPGVGADEIARINQGIGAIAARRTYSGVYEVKIPEKAHDKVLEAYKRILAVEYAEPNYIATAFMVPSDPLYSYQWHFDIPEENENEDWHGGNGGGINLEPVWDLSTGMGVIVAVIDTGVAYEDYEEFVDNPGRSKDYWITYKQAPDLANTDFVPGYDFVNNDNHPNDDNSHGTHVTGTIAQSTNNLIPGEGYVGVAGVAFDTSIMPVKVLNSNGSGYYSWIADGIRWAADNGANVINLSLGGSSSDNTLRDAIAYAYAKGVTIIAAAGNNGSSQVSYPAAYDDWVIAVGATRYDETLAYYSNYGSSLDLVAPGGDIYANQNGDEYGDGVLQNTFNPNTKNTEDFGYWFFQGTSMASPHVAGVAALLIADDVATTPDEVREALQSTAEDKGATGWDPVYGWGIVDAYAALNYNQVPNNPPVADANGPYSGTEDIAVTFDGSGSSDPDGDPLTYAWDFGDESTGTGENPTHIYTAGGTYTVTLVVNDGKANSEPSTTEAVIVEVNDPPIADAGPDQTASVGKTVEFDGSGSYDIDDGIVKYDWDFGDGATGSGMTTTHAYSTAGTYTVTLTVTDNGGLTATDTAEVTVTEESTLLMHVDDIEMSPGGSRKAGRNLFVWAEATVTIVGAGGSPVQGATVYGQWSGATSDSDSGVTDSSGQVTLLSDEKKNPTDGTTFTFCVDNVTKDGWTYDSSSNVTCDSIAYSESWLTTGSSVALLQAFPTPGNPEVWIPFKLANTEHVVIRIYDAAGRLVRMLDLGHKAPGAYVSKEKAAYWDGRNESGEEATSGIYFYLMEAGSFRAMKKMIILK